MIDYLREHLIGFLGGLLALSWCVHLYLLLVATSSGDKTGMYFELGIVIGHELLVAGLVLYSKLRTMKNRRQ